MSVSECKLGMGVAYRFECSGWPVLKLSTEGATPSGITPTGSLEMFDMMNMSGLRPAAGL
jgi:hypothetical protein